jgi:hypothetical protein
MAYTKITKYPNDTIMIGCVLFMENMEISFSHTSVGHT